MQTDTAAFRARRRSSICEAGNHADRDVRVLDSHRHAEGSASHGESSKNGKRANEHCFCIGGMLESDRRELTRA